MLVALSMPAFNALRTYSNRSPLTMISYTHFTSLEISLLSLLVIHEQYASLVVAIASEYFLPPTLLPEAANFPTTYGTVFMPAIACSAASNAASSDFARMRNIPPATPSVIPNFLST